MRAAVSGIGMKLMPSDLLEEAKANEPFAVVSSPACDCGHILADDFTAHHFTCKSLWKIIQLPSGSKRVHTGLIKGVS
ncbi:MAG: hypothetical protein QG633_372 [Patescibacteria group bacterium]|nr:hypothetical protein [Patescibacteria group bacterium]